MSEHSLYKVRARLVEWGEWSRRGAGNNLGYPCQAAHLNERSGAHSDNYIQSDKVAETDRAILQLSHAHPVMFDVLQQEYYWQSTIAGGARRLGISEKTYKSRRLMAEYWMDSRLNTSVYQKSVDRVPQFYV